VSRQTEEKLKELVTWFNEFESYMGHPSIDKQMEALRKLQTNIIWLVTYVVEDIQVLERRHGRGGTGLVLPQVQKLDSALREGGDQR
jgi:hypothetical protein